MTTQANVSQAGEGLTVVTVNITDGNPHRFPSTPNIKRVFVMAQTGGANAASAFIGDDAAQPYELKADGSKDKYWHFSDPARLTYIGTPGDKIHLLIET